MAVYVLLSFDDDQAAKELVEHLVSDEPFVTLDKIDRDTRASRTIDLRTQVRAVFKKPTMFCDCGGDRKTGEGGSTRGKKYGWWVHARCGKPKKFWAEGDQWYALGTNLLPMALLERLGLPLERRPQGWKTEQSWTFLLDESECDWDYARGTKWCYDHKRPLEECRGQEGS